MGFFAKIIGVAVSILLSLGALVHPHAQLSAPVPMTTTTASTSTQSFPVAKTVTSTKVTTPVPKTTPSQPATAQPPVSPSSPSLSSTELNNQTRAALVNIECTTIAGGTFEPISGSGVLVDSDGIILTNAHVGQFFLLRDYGEQNNLQCFIRTGSPAQNAYTAELLYLPPAWVAVNAPQIVAQEPSGDGQNDFAFLRITGTTNGSTLPDPLPYYLTMSTADPDIGNQMLLAAYPAGFLSGQLIATQLYASSAFAYVTQLFSYGTSSPAYVDLFSVGGSIESQQGSSGGAVVNQDGTLAGIIDTDTTAASTGERDLRALSIDYINRQLQVSGQGGIAGLLSGDLAKKAADFNVNVAPQETTELEAVLNNYYSAQ